MSGHNWWMFCFHDWRLKGVCNRIEPLLDCFGGALIDVGNSRTDVLYVCPCGKVKTKTLRGTWTLEQVQP